MNFFDLSERQQRIIHFIVEFTQRNHYPPSIREIGDHVRISSTSVVKYNLSKLESYGFISRAPDKSRGLSVNFSALLASGYPLRQNGESLQEAALGKETSTVRRAPELEYTVEDAVHESPVERVTARRLRVPILGKIAAGSPIAVNPREAYDPEDWIELAEGLLNVPADNLFALRVQGDSMIDASVLDGDIVILRHQETAEDGDMVAAWIEGDEETTLKFLQREGPNVRLIPANPNPEYQPIVRPADKVRINGKVVSVIRVLK
ncbi:MAG: transcriptional repressor LexA [Caldilinea sp.]|nr:transcriptional repressor LexA [Caldilinea sp.]MDW8439206.1 transcriptional repressor LexA [Caldilineaceae bacterium]